MNEYNEFISQQTVPPYGGQLAARSDWSTSVEDERPADQEPPQDAAPAPEEPAAEAPEDPVADTAEAEPAPEAEPQAAEVAESETTAEVAESETVAEIVESETTAEVAESETVAEPEAAVAEAEPETPAEAEAGSDVRAADDLTAEHLIDPADAERFHSGWREVKAAFVDGPPDAVQQASALVGEAVDEVTTALTRLRENLDRRSQDTDEADTERLRLVLRGYGSLLTHILTR